MTTNTSATDVNIDILSQNNVSNEPKIYNANTVTQKVIPKHNAGKQIDPSKLSFIIYLFLNIPLHLNIFHEYL